MTVNEGTRQQSTDLESTLLLSFLRGDRREFDLTMACLSYADLQALATHLVGLEEMLRQEADKRLGREDHGFERHDASSRQPTRRTAPRSHEC
jgi:hypothetical protein